MFKIDYDLAKNYVEGGIYEMYFEDYEQRVANSGTRFFVLHGVIRKDVNQSNQGRKVFYNLWCSKETGDLNMGFVAQIAKAIKLANGTEFKSEDDVLKALMYKPFKAKITLETNEFNGKQYTNNVYKGFKESDFPQIAPGTMVEGATMINNNSNNEDVPF